MQLRNRNSDTNPEENRSRSFGEHHLPPPHATQRVAAPAPEISNELDHLAASLQEVEPRASRRLRDLATALTTDTGRQRWSDVDLRRAFNTDRLALAYAVRREGGYAPQSIEVADKVRNILVLVPILLTWAALGEAARAYDRYLAANPDDQGVPFLLLWQRGFGGEASLFSPTFSTVALLDAVVIIVIILLTFYAHGRREAQEDQIADTAAEFQATLDNSLAEASVLLATDKASRPTHLTETIERLADTFSTNSQALLNQLQVEHDRLEHVASRREKEFADFGVFASGMRAGAEQIHRLLVDLREVSSGLEGALEDLTSEVTTSASQQQTLLSAVASLERMTSSAIQSDQAVSRQLTTAARTLAEAADRAISGAESAAQAGRVAADAVRGISALAEQVSESQQRVGSALESQTAASSTLAESLRTSTAGAQATAQTLTEIGNELSRIRDGFERIGATSTRQGDDLATMLGRQAEITQEMSQVVREIGNIGLGTAQRQRESAQDLQHLVQRLDGLANTLNRIVQQAPNVENLQQAFTSALRAEMNRPQTEPSEPVTPAPARWSRQRS